MTMDMNVGQEFADPDKISRLGCCKADQIKGR